MAIINPYADVNWSSAERILSISHQHLSGKTTQTTFDWIHNSGVRHYAFSHYRPSVITYPPDYTAHTFEYLGAIPEEDQHADYETVKSRYTKTISFGSDDSLIFSPNAEHVNPMIYLKSGWNKWTGVHINAMGSLLETGTAPEDGYDTATCGMKYTDLIDAIIENLQYEDGGGVIFNHYYYTAELVSRTSYDTYRFLTDCLDYSPLVLGTDIISDGRMIAYPYQINVWDNILKTGRRCWGFGQNDWSYRFERGRNSLLIPPSALASKETAEHECLKSYRKGSFIIRYANTALDIADLQFDGTTYSVTAANADGIDIIIDGISQTFRNTGGDASFTASVTVPSDAVYVRAAAYTDKDDDPEWVYQEGDLYKDICLLNPIMIHPRVYEYDPAYDGDVNPDPPPAKRAKSKLILWG